MQFSHLKMCFHSLPINRVPNTSFSPVTCHIIGAKSRKRVKKLSYQGSLVKNKCGLISPTKSHAFPASSIVDTENAPDILQWYEQELGFVGVKMDGSFNSKETYTEKDQKERERRKKIGLANKGKVPWNKGKKHTTETLELISQRTKEAMMDPKVRKKMAECPRAHSEQTKERIGTSLRRVWAEKLKWKRSRAKFLSVWTNSIAQAAKKGGCDQQELDWDSYDNIKEEIAIQHHRWAADRAEAKEMAKLEAAERKAEKKARLAREREKQAKRATSGGEVKRKTRRKSKEEREELTVAVGLKLKERLTKIHKRKLSTNGQISGEDQRSWEKLDVNFLKTEGRRREISLADQIQAAKTGKVELEEKSTSLSFLYSPSEN